MTAEKVTQMRYSTYSTIKMVHYEKENCEEKIDRTNNKHFALSLAWWLHYHFQTEADINIQEDTSLNLWPQQENKSTSSHSAYVTLTTFLEPQHIKVNIKTKLFIKSKNVQSIYLYDTFTTQDTYWNISKNFPVYLFLVCEDMIIILIICSFICQFLLRQTYNT